MSAPAAPDGAAPEPWYAAYPAARNQSPQTISRSTILEWLKQGNLPGKDYLLVDLRRADFEGGSIRGSINLPAQSLYHSIPTLYGLFSAAGISKVIFYCSSSRGRGPRAAGWFDDYISDRGDGRLQSLVLAEGIKGWARAGQDYVEFMDDYQAEAWAA